MSSLIGSRIPRVWALALSLVYFGTSAGLYTLVAGLLAGVLTLVSARMQRTPLLTPAAVSQQ
jgi:hypothetical protein